MLLFLFPLLILGFDVSRGEIVLDKGQPRVDTEYGTVYGSVETLKSKKEIYTFKGIPFAAAPVGQLRFEKPQTVKPFGVINGTQFGPQCVIFSKNQESDTKVQGQEDCLTLNIAVPRTRQKPPRLLPVMVLVVGGGYIQSQADRRHTDHFHEHFVTRGIVYVTFHYRVGALGYYSDVSPSSNVALHDKRAALQFVQKTISSFHGDPSRVTVFADSAGSTELSLLTFSHLSRGLFKQTIHFCGNAHNMVIRGKNNENTSRMLEKRLNCSGKADKKHCLKDKDIRDIWDHGSEVYMGIPDDLDVTRYSPTFYDSDFMDGATFEEAMKSADNVASLYGSNTIEDTITGIQSNAVCGARYCPISEKLAANFTVLDLRRSLEYLLTKERGFDRTDAAVAEIVKFYESQGAENAEHQPLQAFVQFFSDLHFVIGALREAKLKARHGRRVYFYVNKFSIRGHPLVSPLLVGTPHCFESFFIFDDWTAFHSPGERASYVQVRAEFIQMWVHFVKHGVAKINGTTLPVVTPHRVPHVVIDKDISFQQDLWQDRAAFWENIRRKYGFDWITGTDFPM